MELKVLLLNMIKDAKFQKQLKETVKTEQILAPTTTQNKCPTIRVGHNLINWLCFVCWEEDRFLEFLELSQRHHYNLNISSL